MHRIAGENPGNLFTAGSSLSIFVTGGLEPSKPKVAGSNPAGVSSYGEISEFRFEKSLDRVASIDYMPQKINPIDPDDNLIVDVVGSWAIEKHERLKKYIDASRGARTKFLPPNNDGGASYIELFSGPGRSLIRDTGRIINGSPLVAYNAARASGASFSDLHFGDIEAANCEAVAARIRASGGVPNIYVGPAYTVVDTVVAALNPYGLHFAFMDPYNLEQLPFSIIERLATIRRMDMLIHVSVQDLQRNLDQYSQPGGVLDKFMPGWRDRVDIKQSIAPLRAALLEYWLTKIRALGTIPAQGIELVAGGRNQRLYWLVFVSAHDLGQKLWEAIRDIRGQTEMGF
jgi:three-Cys-motif partner protein